MNTKIQLEKLQEKWHKNCLCPLKKLATQPVFGNGNPQAEIVFIGEAPGKEEDLKGKPFVGSAGKLLEQMLKSINLNREDVYITNIVKYRPPNNRDPLPQEKKACIDWLYDELNFIKPKLIVFLGRHSFLYFFPNEKISQLHGKLLVKKINKVPTKYFLPLYHPATALYNPSLKGILLKDFRKIPFILKKIKSEINNNN